MDSTTAPAHTVEQRTRVVIRFAGDSGDGMQLTGDRFTAEAAAFGNDLATLPNFPAEIRAPHGTLAGVSSFQLHFADYDILTPGDRPDVLVAMNPAALKANLGDLPGRRRADPGHRRVHQAEPGQGRFRRGPAGGRLAGAVHGAPGGHDLADHVRRSRPLGIGKKEAERSKNMFALGLLAWMYSRPTEGTERWLREKFARSCRRSPRPTCWPSAPGTPTARRPSPSR